MRNLHSRTTPMQCCREECSELSAAHMSNGPRAHQTCPWTSSRLPIRFIKLLASDYIRRQTIGALEVPGDLSWLTRPKDVAPALSNLRRLLHTRKDRRQARSCSRSHTSISTRRFLTSQFASLSVSPGTTISASDDDRRYLEDTVLLGATYFRTF